MSKKGKSATGVSARQRLKEERARQAQAERRRENMLRVGIGLGVAIVVIALFGLVQWQRSQVDEGAAAPAAAAGGVGTGIVYGDQDAKVEVELFEDFLCPHCAAFQADAEPVLQEYLDSGDIRVLYYPVTLSSFGEPTERAANAYACAADQGSEEALAYQNALFANAGTEWTNERLLDLGESQGLDDSFRSCVEGDDFAEYVRSIDQTFTERGATGTPTVFVNGEELTLPGGDALREAIERELESADGAAE